ncbi:TetR/AcrR family transcriptional regulator [Williamsia serinedens]|uniref:Transcriptional regulator, TetR family n=1 Tax=Williamsia serinedens TaxID=391736 RepID=A0ABT1H290_9NOCA|nr:TetR/AcrR family transcriptional regulator [Williamsia serinedens]MCP2159937.1 transcriptional regulator, TetR family [Williamsia serinedens]
MPRSGAGARARLREAALDLYEQQGYDATTTAQIAERAGVTERTYFRHFADKREVLFDGEAALLDTMVAAIVDAPDDLSLLALVLRAYDGAVPLVVAGRPVAHRRARIIATSPALQERARAKAAAVDEAVTHAVAGRGVPEPTARLTARIGAAIFERAVADWNGVGADDLTRLIDAASAEVSDLVRRD